MNIIIRVKRQYLKLSVSKEMINIEFDWNT